MRRAAILLAAALLTGCGETDEGTTGPDDGGATPALEIGFTDPDDNSYRTVGHLGDMPVYRGFQGGSHLFVTLRAQGLTADDQGQALLLMEESLEVAAGGNMLGELTSQVAFQHLGSALFELSMHFMFLDAVVTDLDNKDVYLAFRLASTDGATLYAERRQLVTLRRVVEPPPGSVQAQDLAP
jgi:hypothetical protein